jgi:YD repeat-containing protein
VAPDGNLYIADTEHNRVRRVGPDGVITTFAGNAAVDTFAGDGGPATQAALFRPSDVMVAPDGALYIVDSGNHRIRRVGTDGIIVTVAGNGRSGFNGDGIPATQASLQFPLGGTVGPDGKLYIADTLNNRIRRVGADGIIATIAGNGAFGFSGDSGPATLAALANPQHVAAAPDRRFYIADTNNFRVRRFATPLPSFSGSSFGVVSEAGDELHLFSADGRHERTVNALTGATRYQLTYDGARLTAVSDGDGNVTRIERDASGNPTAIIAPFGQRTALAVNGDGYLSQITNPAGESIRLAYSPDGLLGSFTDARGNSSRYGYDAEGRLTGIDDAVGGSKTLTRTDTANGYTVSLRSAVGRTTTYGIERLPTGETRRTVNDPSGARAEIVIGAGGTLRITDRDGTVSRVVPGPDPRWGMQAPIVSSLIVTTPGGITRTVTGNPYGDAGGLQGSTELANADRHRHRKWSRVHQPVRRRHTQQDGDQRRRAYAHVHAGCQGPRHPGAGHRARAHQLHVR